MQIEFYKYQGAGNDFVMIDNREKTFPVNMKLVNLLCNRKFGIGADGLILLQKHEGYDFEMVYFNADGNLASMCGNGGRCVAAFARQLGIGKGSFHFLAVDGPHKAVFKEVMVSLQMKNVDDVQDRGSVMVLDTGSPHYVQFMHEIEDLDVVKLGREVRYSPEFKEKGINVNFVASDNDFPNHISIRTYERGVEDETLACGTGVVASAISYYHHSLKDGNEAKSPHIYVSASGGELEVDFDFDPKGYYTNIWLTGPAEMVFEGKCNI